MFFITANLLIKCMLQTYEGAGGDFYSIYMLFRNIVINIFVTNN